MPNVTVTAHDALFYMILWCDAEITCKLFHHNKLAVITALHVMFDKKQNINQQQMTLKDPEC